MGARIVKLALASACTFMMAGCVAGNSHVGGATGLAAFPRAQILGDAAKELGKLFPPALTKVEVLGDRRDPLREDFLALLRRRGFAVVDRPEKGAPPVKGTLPVKIDLTNLDENTVFTRIQMGNQSAARAYTVDPYVKAVAAWTVNLTGAREEVEERAFRAPDYTEAPPSAGAPKAAEPVQAPLPVAAAPVPEQASTPSLGHWTLYMGTLHTRDQVVRYWNHLVQVRPALKRWQHTTYRQTSGRYELLMLGEGDPHSALALCRSAKAHACSIGN